MPVVILVLLSVAQRALQVAVSHTFRLLGNKRKSNWPPLRSLNARVSSPGTASWRGDLGVPMPSSAS